MLGERLSARLTAMGMSQSELARRVGISQGTVGKLLTGKNRSSTHLHKIARELETTPEYLSGETDNPSPGAVAAAPQLSSEDRATLEKLRALSPANRAAVMQMIKALAGRDGE